MNNESILNTTSAINDIINNSHLSINNKKEAFEALNQDDPYRFNFTFIKNTSFLEQLLLSDNEKYELTNFVIDHLINYLEKDDSILHNIGHPVCYFLSRMDKNTPVFLELFLNNGLNVDSQLSYNNKHNLYLLDYFSINNLKPDTQTIIECLDVLKSYNYNFKKYNFNSEDYNDNCSSYVDFYIKNNFDIKAILALKNYDINPITEQEKYLILSNYYKDKKKIKILIKKLIQYLNLIYIMPD